MLQPVIAMPDSAMPASDFSTFFSTASGSQRQPYEYQKRLACGERAEGQSESSWLLQSGPCESRLISIPTGLGKTAAVILAWLWSRVHLKSDKWPRRLVYCLPMRTLVEQTRDEAEKWLKAHDVLWDNDPKTHSGKVGLHVLMGGEEAGEWDLYPEENAILIGTQDMLLSRALNRGYGMSRYRWPMHFGLLNNDCLWVLDETQLMGVGVETSAQLDGFRHLKQWLQHGPCPTWWMSATLEDARLATVDHPPPNGGWPRLELTEAEKKTESVRKLIEARKPVEAAAYKLAASTKGDHASQLASMIKDQHQDGTLTLVVLNRVQRAQELFQALTAPRKEGRQALPPLYTEDKVGLIHSRFRPQDREKHQQLLFEEGKDRIIIATQAVEAGVDVSARLLITELAPWSSLVQRFGRCNRRGALEDAKVLWIDIQPKDGKDELCLPYEMEELQAARDAIAGLADAGPQSLASIRVPEKQVIRPVIRRKDVLDLFDTTPDIAGHDLDISRYIREGEDSDVQVFWRDLSATNFKPSNDSAGPARGELCRVSVHRFKAFLKKLNENKEGPKAWLWDGLREEWGIATHSRAGATYLLDRRAGGYDPLLGWTDEVAKKAAHWVPVIESEKTASPDASPRDPLTRLGRPISLETHTRDVLEHTRSIARTVAAAHAPALETAALWHDVGKSLPDFQQMLRGAAIGETIPQGILAKSGKRGGSMPVWRKQFRHELASALAWLANHEEAEQANLIAYIIAAHHGKVRLSIRSLPEEQPPEDKPATSVIARGILDGEDMLPALSLEGLIMPETMLSLDLMKMGSDDNGHPSWLARMIALRDGMGPFALAYLETLLRAADMRASADEAKALS